MITASFILDAAERPRALLADDHPAMLALPAAAPAGECLVVGSVGDGRALLTEAERLHPDVIVLDITMPDLDGIEAGRRNTCAAALHAGGTAYVLNGRLAPDLITAIRKALVEHSFVSPMICLAAE